MDPPPYREPLAPREVPPFPGLWLTLGPGIVWMALAQGSGELIWWPKVVARYGLAFLFLLVPACLLQLPLNYQMGCYTVLTGQSIFQGFMRMSRLFAFLLWVLLAASFLWFGAFAGAGATSLAALTGFPRGWERGAQILFWTYLSMAVFFSGLMLSRLVYALIEKLMWFVSLVTLVGLLVSAFHPAVRPLWGSFFLSLVRPPEWPPPRLDPQDVTTLLTAVTFVGLGGFWTLFYSYWLREKGVGMAAHLWREADLPRGCTFARTPQNLARIRPWKRFLLVDSGVGVAGNLLTTLLTCLLAYAFLHPRGLLPEGENIAVVQAEFFEASWGVVGRLAFLFMAACFLGDSWVVTVDGVSRIHTDFLKEFFPILRRVSQRAAYRFFVFLLTAVTAVTVLYKEPATQMQLSAVLGFVGTVLFSFGFLVLNYHTLPRLVPREACPGRLAFAAMLLSAMAYLALAAAYLWQLFSRITVP